ncbi:MAG: hypothetical protein JXA44_13590 [Methanospirillaceae archaeon]|nr:hypothetical protein [Methanospirillaceae archaeon]
MLCSRDHEIKDTGTLPVSYIAHIMQTGECETGIRDNILVHAQRTAEALLTCRSLDPRLAIVYWEWLSDNTITTISAKDANKFLLGCILDRRAEGIDIWDNTRFVIDDILGDPPRLWHLIREYSPDEWNKQAIIFDLHPQEKIHNAIWHIAGEMIRWYHGDARQIWSDCEQNPREIAHRLKRLGVPPITASMILGALKDEGYVTGPCDVRADAPVARILARLICGMEEKLTEYEAVRIARLMYPKDPWVLDRPLYLIGINYCHIKPACSGCPVHEYCLYCRTQKEERKTPYCVYKELFGKRTIQTSLDLF